MYLQGVSDVNLIDFEVKEYSFKVSKFQSRTRRLSATVFLTSEILDFLGKSLSVYILSKNYSLFCKMFVSNIAAYFSVGGTRTIFNPIQDGSFRGCSWIYHTYPSVMKLGTVIPYLKKTEKNYESCDTPL